MTAYERALAAMGDQLDENQKKRLRDAAQLLDQGNAETRRTSFAQEQTGIVQDTQQLAAQGLAGNAYSGFQSGAQERRVKTREGVYDMTLNTLNTQETTALVATGQKLVAQKRAAEEERRRKARELYNQRAALSLAPLVAEKRAFMESQPAKQPTVQASAAKPNAWQAAYDTVAKNTGTGAQGLLNLFNMTPEQRQRNQQEIYNAVQAAGGTSQANTMFGLNPIKNAVDAQNAGKAATAAAEAIRRQQERTAPLDKATGAASIEQIDARLDELDMLIARANGNLQYVRSAEQQNAALANLSALKAEKTVLEEDRRNTDRRVRATVYAEYMDLAEKPDFTEKSKTDTRVENDFYRGVNGMFAKNDPTGALKSLNENTLPLGGETVTLDGKGYKNGVEAAKYITDEEKEVYNYIFATQGEEKAQQFIEDVSNVLNARYAVEERDKFAKMADEQPILASAMTILATPFKAGALPYAFTTNRGIDPNSPYFWASRVSQIVRSEVAAKIEDGIGRLDRYSPAQLKKMGYSDADIVRIENGELRKNGSEAVGAALSFIYYTGMSIGDFLLSSSTGGPAALMIMGTGSAADTVMEAKQRGASDGDALTLGVVAGIAEVITEKFSLDHFYKMKTAGKLANLKNILAQMGIEASEEMASEIINITADAMVMGENSNARLLVNAYMAAGMTKQEAEAEVFKENLVQIMLAGLGGALSGGVIGGGKIAGTRVIQGVKNGRMDLTDPKIQAQLDYDTVKAQEKKEQDAAKDAATRVQNINLEDMKATDANPVKATLVDVAAAEMKGKGEPDNVVAEVKAVLDKQMRGEPITAAERFILISNPTIRDAFNITEPVPKMRVGANGVMQKAVEQQAAPTTEKTVVEQPAPQAEDSAPVVEQPATPDEAKPSAKSEVYKEQLAKSFVKDVTDGIGLTKETGAAKELSKAINTVMEKGEFSSDEQNALFDKIAKDLPEGTNVARARIAFDDAVFNVRMSLGLVDRYEAARHAKKQQRAERAADANDMPLVKKALEDRKPLARQLQKIKDDNVFTQQDTNDIEYILKGGEINLEGRTNAAAFKQRLEVERKLRAADQIISDYNKQRKKGLFDQAVRAISGSESWKDKKWGLGYSTETMERNIEDIVKDPAQAELLIKTYMSPVHSNEAASTRFKNDYRSRIDALNLNNAEKKAVQLMGEGSTEDMIKTQLGESVFKKVNMTKVSAAVDTFRSIYDELITAANESLIRNGYPPIEYRKNYFPHFNDPEPDTVMKKVAQALGVNIAAEELPTDLAGLTATFKPGKSYFAHLLERKGEATTIDAVKGFETYIAGVSDIVHHTDDIQRWRALESALRYEHSNEAIRKRMMDVMNSSAYDPDAQQTEYDAIFGEKQGHLGKLVEEIREYTNMLANKKSITDRGVEKDTSRKMYHVVNTLNSRVAANMVGGNIGVALTNFIPLTQAWASTKTKFMYMGMTQSIAAMFKDDGFSAQSDFVTNRKGSESLDATGVQKASRIAALPFTLVDTFVSESIVRAQYMQNIEKGMSQEDALQAADEWAGRIMADRSKGALPTYFKRSNPVSKMFGMFQVEVNNQFRHAFKDLPRALRDRGLAAIAMALFKLCLGAWVYNELTEPLTGRRAALDPANILMEFSLDLAKKDLGTATLTQYLAGKGDDPLKLQDKDVSTAKAIENLWENLMDQTPFVGSFLGGEGGRVPISSAIPSLWGIGIVEAAEGNKSWDKVGENALKEAKKPLLYLLPPFGGGQAKKMYEGITTVIKGASTTLNNEGEERIQFTTEQGLREYLQATVFGKWSLPDAQRYVRNGFDMMTTRESEGYKAARAAGIDTDYMRVRAELAKIKPTKDQFGETIDSAATLQRRALMNWPGLTAEQKQTFDKHLIANENGRSYDYSNPALLELKLIDERTYEKAVTAQRQGISPETYLDYAQLKSEYDKVYDDLKARGQETIPVNERMHDAIWNEESLNETQKFQLEAAITGQSGWMDKAMLAARAAVRNDKFYTIASKVRDYEGNESLSNYAWSVIRADKSLTPEQQLKMQELLSPAINKTKMDRIVLAGVPKEPAYRYLALYRDYVSDDKENELDYSDEKAFKLAVSRERGLSPEDKMKITDAVLGSDSKIFSDWQQANVVAKINPKAFYDFQMVCIQTDGKDENGNTVNYLKKNRLKEYLKSTGLTQEQMEYLLFHAPGTDYTKW